MLENAVLRADAKPLLVIGEIFEARKVGDKCYLGIQWQGDIDIDFIAECSADVQIKVLNQPTDKGRLFASIIKAQVVKRPTFEADAYPIDSNEAEIIIEPSDKYTVIGTCLDVVYLGK